MKKTIVLILKSIFENTISILRLLLNTSLINKLKRKDQTKGDVCYIFGNGPSLFNDIDGEKINIDNKNIFVVNNFALSDLFTEFKPNNYILIDPIYWIKEKELMPQWYTQREALLETIKNKTSWILNLYVSPKVFKSRFFQEYFKTNQFIKITPFNIINVNGNKNFKTICYKNNWGTPITNNVLGAAIYIAIFKKFKTIYVLGADHSWTKDLVVNHNNEVCIEDSHFYNQKSNPEPWKKFDGTNFKMHEILKSFSTMFYSYEELRMFSDSMNVKVINCTRNSFIDSFERKYKDV